METTINPDLMKSLKKAVSKIIREHSLEVEHYCDDPISRHYGFHPVMEFDSDPTAKRVVRLLTGRNVSVDDFKQWLISSDNRGNLPHWEMTANESICFYLAMVFNL